MSECQRDMMASGKPYPRSCPTCGLGPCQKYEKGDYPTNFPEEAKKPVNQNISDKELAAQYRDELARALQPVTEIFDRAKAQGLILGFGYQLDVLGRNIVQQITVARHY